MNRTLFASFLVLSVAAGVYAQSEFAPQTLLKPRTTVIYSIPPNVDARTGYDLLGTRSGINMVYVSSFKPDTPVPLRIEGQTNFSERPAPPIQSGPADPTR
jgi:hypothetical protein